MNCYTRYYCTTPRWVCQPNNTESNRASTHLIQTLHSETEVSWFHCSLIWFFLRWINWGAMPAKIFEGRSLCQNRQFLCQNCDLVGWRQTREIAATAADYIVHCATWHRANCAKGHLLCEERRKEKDKLVSANNYHRTMQNWAVLYYRS